MLNIFSLIYLNYALYPNNILFVKLPEAYAFFNPDVNVMPIIPLLFFPLSLCLASCSKFSIRSLIVS